MGVYGGVMSNWSKAEGRIISVRVSEGVYAFLQARADAKGVTIGVYVKQVLSNGAAKNVNVPG